MSQQMNLWKRLSGESPKFFKRVSKIAISAAAAATAVLTAPTIIKGFVLSSTLSTLCQYAIVAGLAAAGVSKTTLATTTKEDPTPKV